MRVCLLSASGAESWPAPRSERQQILRSMAQSVQQNVMHALGAFDGKHAIGLTWPRALATIAIGGRQTCCGTLADVGHGSASSQQATSALGPRHAPRGDKIWGARPASAHGAQHVQVRPVTLGLGLCPLRRQGWRSCAALPHAEACKFKRQGGDCAPRCRTQKRAKCENSVGNFAPRCRTRKPAKCKNSVGDCAPRCCTQKRAKYEGRGVDSAPRCHTQKRAKCKNSGGNRAPRCHTQRRAKCEGRGVDSAPRCRSKERAKCECRGGDCAPLCNTQMKRAKWKKQGRRQCAALPHAEARKV
eukprot:5985863-Pleurochrysis_carterae.AAC.1